MPMQWLMIMVMTFLASGCAADQKYVIQAQLPMAQDSSVLKPPATPATMEIVQMDQGFLSEVMENTAIINGTPDVQLQGRAIVRPDNLTVFPYGLTQPRLVCGALRVCSIELQEGERINNIVSGDNQRWQIRAVYVGSGPHLKPLIMVKPHFGQGIETNIVITTDRRIYDVHLRSVDQGQYTPRIGFFYPQEDHLNIPEPPEERKTPQDTPRIKGELNFRYRLKGDKRLSWYPALVFDDGQKVFIKMPETVKNHQLPIFMGLTNRGNPEIINYRYQEPFIVVDRLFESGLLTLQKGKTKNHIEIHKK